MNLDKIYVFLQIILILVIPILIIGFDWFEDSPSYKVLFNFVGVEKAISYRLTTQCDAHQLMLDKDNKNMKEEFDGLLNLIRLNSTVPIPVEEPKYISRIGLDNATYVMLPGDKKCFLIPDSTPIVLAYCENTASDSQCNTDFEEEQVILVGTVGDIKQWHYNSKAAVKTVVNFIITVISIAVAASLFFKEHYKEK